MAGEAILSCPNANKTAGFRPIPRWGERLRPLVSAPPRRGMLPPRRGAPQRYH